MIVPSCDVVMDVLLKVRGERNIKMEGGREREGGREMRPGTQILCPNLAAKHPIRRRSLLLDS